MKLDFRDFKIGLIIALGVVGAISIKKISDHIFSIDGFSCKIDNNISQAYSCKIISFLHEHKYLKTCCLQGLSEKIQTKFPFIKSIRILKKASGILHIRMGAAAPAFVINKIFVLSREGGLFENVVFSKQAIANLVYIEASLQDFTLADSLKKMLKGLPATCFTDYDLLWESSAKSWLRDKNCNAFSIVFNDTRVVNEKILLTCNKLKNELKERGVFHVKQPKRWIADVRFKDQIIVFSDRGGGNG